MRLIPWEEIEAELMQRPGFAEACEQADRELDEEIAIYGTIGNPKSPLPPFGKGGKDCPRPVFTRTAAKRKSPGFSAKLKRTRATA